LTILLNKRPRRRPPVVDADAGVVLVAVVVGDVVVAKLHATYVKMVELCGGAFDTNACTFHALSISNTFLRSFVKTFFWDGCHLLKNC
jgi:hypothetical protein